MSICIYSPSENIWGGGQIYIDHLCRYLNANGMQAVIATVEPDSFSQPAIRIPSVASKRKRLTSTSSVVRLLRGRRIKVVILNDLSALWLAPVFRVRGFYVISLLHMYLQRKNADGFGHSRVEYHILRMASRFAHRVYSVNKENQSSFPVPVQFVGNFISGWFFREPNLKKKKYDLGLVARLSPEKNIPLFIRLVAELNQFAPRPITALIVGRGEEEIVARREIDRLFMSGLIEIRPWVDRSELPEVFDQLRCFAITSYHEGFPTTLLEAHARGVPAIATASAGFAPEFISAWGPKTGLAFTPSEIRSDAFLASLIALIDDYAAYFDACREKAALFTEDMVLGAIQAGIDNLVHGSALDRSLSKR